MICNFLFPLVVHVFFPWIASVSQYFQVCGIFAVSSLAMSTLGRANENSFCGGNKHLYHNQNEDTAKAFIRLAGFSLSTMIPRIEYLQIVLVPFETICMTLMGGWINVESIPSYFMWIKYLSPFYYSYEAISITIWGENAGTQRCQTIQINAFKVIFFADCSSNTTNSCITGKDFLLSLGLHTNKWYVLNDISYLAIYVLICSAIGFICLSRAR